MTKPSLPVKGYVKVWADDKLVAEGSNRVVTKGLELLAQLINSESVELPKVFRFGTSSAATIDSMDNLQGSFLFSEDAEVVRTGNVLKWSWEGKYSGAEVVQVGEIGIFNSTLIMLARFVPIPAFTLSNGASVRISWEIKIGG